MLLFHSSPFFLSLDIANSLQDFLLPTTFLYNLMSVALAVRTTFVSPCRCVIPAQMRIAKSFPVSLSLSHTLLLPLLILFTTGNRKRTPFSQSAPVESHPVRGKHSICWTSFFFLPFFFNHHYYYHHYLLFFNNSPNKQHKKNQFFIIIIRKCNSIV